MKAITGTLPSLSVIKADQRGREQPPSTEIAHDELANNLIVGFEKLNGRAQPFVRMRSKLIRYAKDTGRRLFAVASVEPGAGKTHVAINLAAALSRITPTILIELDLRRPSIAPRLGLAAAHQGVDDFIEGKAPWNETGVRIHGFDLDVHCIRVARDNAEELLTSGGLQSLFATLRESEGHPICIIDTSPMTVDDDFMLIAPAVDGVLVVVEEGRTSRRALLEAVDALNALPIVGTVLNKSIWSAGNETDYGYYGDQ